MTRMLILAIFGYTLVGLPYGKIVHDNSMNSIKSMNFGGIVGIFISLIINCILLKIPISVYSSVYDICLFGMFVGLLFSTNLILDNIPVLMLTVPTVMIFSTIGGIVFMFLRIYIMQSDEFLNSLLLIRRIKLFCYLTLTVGVNYVYRKIYHKMYYN